MLSKYLVSKNFKFEINLCKTSFYILFLIIPIYNFTQQTNNLSSVDKLFTNWDNSKYQNLNNVLHLTCQPIDTVRIAVIGLGNRGQMALERLPKIEGAKIIAIADFDL